MTTDASRLIERMIQFVSALPVRLALSADSDYEVSIQRLSTAPSCRLQGHARMVLQELTACADEYGVDLELEALPDDEEDAISLEALAGLYRSVGFTGEVDEEEGAVRMSRSAVAPAAIRGR